MNFVKITISNGQVLVINLAQIAYVEIAPAPSAKSATMYFSGLDCDGRPQFLEFTGSDVDTMLSLLA
jgi:hypothetical protein